MVACTWEVQLGSARPRGIPAACQVAWWPVIHEVTKVPANADGIHGCICNIDGSCRMSQANGKVTCLEGLCVYIYNPSSRESNQPRNGGCGTGSPAQEGCPYSVAWLGNWRAFWPLCLSLHHCRRLRPSPCSTPSVAAQKLRKDFVYSPPFGDGEPEDQRTGLFQGHGGQCGKASLWVPRPVLS